MEVETPGWMSQSVLSAQPSEPALTQQNSVLYWPRRLASEHQLLIFQKDIPSYLPAEGGEGQPLAGANTEIIISVGATHSTQVKEPKWSSRCNLKHHERPKSESFQVSFDIQGSQHCFKISTTKKEKPFYVNVYISFYICMYRCI